MPIHLVAALALGMAAAPHPQAPATPVDVSVVKRDAGGFMFANDRGHGLYTFDRDGVGKSVCNGQCAIAWPPMPVSAGSRPVGDWSVVTRDDGRAQWAYKGRPVYSFARDTGGAQTGDGMAGAWHLISWR